MRCIYCGRQMQESSLRDLLAGSDPLCLPCRAQWERKDIRFLLDGIRLDSFYVYNEVFSSCLIQYKECGDEALKDVFLYGLEGKIRRMYRGYTFLMMPSSEEKVNERGFSHLAAMAECLRLPAEEPFEKISHASQKRLGREERLKMAGNIRLKDGAVLPEKIVLFDDTVTTGATLRGALSCFDHEGHRIRICTVSYNRRWNDGRRAGVHCLFRHGNV